MQLELTLDDIKWAIVNAKKLKIKEHVSVFIMEFTVFLLSSMQSVIMLPKKNRIRIYVDGDMKYYRLRELKRALSSVVVKVSVGLALNKLD